MFHVVTPFPILLDYSLYAPVLLRLTLGFFILAIGFSSRQKPKADVVVVVDTETTSNQEFGFGEIAYRLLFVLAGFSLIVGFYTQISSIVVAILLLISILDKKARLTDEIGKVELVLLLVIAISLIVLGAGLYAIDLPL